MARGAHRLGLDFEGELARQPRRAQRAQGIGAKHLPRHHPQAAGSEIVPASERVHELAVVEALGDGVDGEIALGQIGLDAGLDQR